MDVLKILPKWLLIAIFVYVAILLSYAVYDNRSVQLFPPSISAKPGPTSNNQADCIAKSEVEAKYLSKVVVERDYVKRARFVAGEWRYFAIAGGIGGAVQNRLNDIQPPPEGLFIAYDGSASNTFHVWYRGSGTGVRYRYSVGTSDELTDPPDRNFFMADQTRVPAGIGTSGGVAVPIYFEFTDPRGRSE
jgi:hypothetical protein